MRDAGAGGAEQRDFVRVELHEVGEPDIWPEQADLLREADRRQLVLRMRRVLVVHGFGQMRVQPQAEAARGVHGVHELGRAHREEWRRRRGDNAAECIRCGDVVRGGRRSRSARYASSVSGRSTSGNSASSWRVSVAPPRHSTRRRPKRPASSNRMAEASNGMPG